MNNNSQLTTHWIWLLIAFIGIVSITCADDKTEPIVSIKADNDSPQAGDSVTYTIPLLKNPDITWGVSVDGIATTKHFTENKDTDSLTIDYQYSELIEKETGENVKVEITATLNNGAVYSTTVYVDPMRYQFNLLSRDTANNTATFAWGVHNLSGDDALLSFLGNTFVSIVEYQINGNAVMRSFSSSSLTLRCPDDSGGTPVFQVGGVTFTCSEPAVAGEYNTKIQVSGYTDEQAMQGIPFNMNLHVAGITVTDSKILMILEGDNAIEDSQEAAFRVQSNDKTYVFDANTALKAETTTD